MHEVRAQLLILRVLKRLLFFTSLASKELRYFRHLVTSSCLAQKVLTQEWWHADRWPFKGFLFVRLCQFWSLTESWFFSMRISTRIKSSERRLHRSFGKVERPHMPSRSRSIVLVEDQRGCRLFQIELLGSLHSVEKSCSDTTYAHKPSPCQCHLQAYQNAVAAGSGCIDGKFSNFQIAGLSKRCGGWQWVHRRQVL